MYENEGCGPVMLQATQRQSCGRLSVTLTRPKFLLPFSLETWRFMIAVVCLSLLWLPYLSHTHTQKSTKKTKKQTKANKKTPHQTGHLEQQHFMSHSGHCFFLMTVRENPSWQWLAFPGLRTHHPNGYCHPWHLPCVCFHRLSLYEAVRLLRVSPRWLHPDCVHTSPITK